MASSAFFQDRMVHLRYVMKTPYLRWSCAIAWAAMLAGSAYGQSAPLTLTLKDALERARMNAPQLLSALNDARAAHEDLLQARAAQRPTASFKSEYLGTQGNGVLPSGRFVSNDGVHLYRDWAVLHQDFIAAFLKTGPQRAAAAET